jgi:hypothetical protein
VKISLLYCSKLKMFCLEFNFGNKAESAGKHRVTHIRYYRNPIFQAIEWQNILRNGEYSNQADLAASLGKSKARVCQIMRPLKLSFRAKDLLIGLGDPLESKLICERQLKLLFGVDPKIQERKIKDLINRPMEDNGC